MDGWKTFCFPFGFRPIFRGEMAVSFRKGTYEICFGQRRRPQQKWWLICEQLLSLPQFILMKYHSLLQCVFWWSTLCTITCICMYIYIYLWRMPHTYIVCICYVYSHILIISLSLSMYIHIISTCNMRKPGAQLLPAVTATSFVWVSFTGPPAKKNPRFCFGGYDMTHATTILQIFLTSPKPVVRFGAIRTLNTSLGLGSFQYTGPENERMSPENQWLVQMFIPIKMDPF